MTKMGEIAKIGGIAKVGEIAKIGEMGEVILYFAFIRYQTSLSFLLYYPNIN